MLRSTDSSARLILSCLVTSGFDAPHMRPPEFKVECALDGEGEVEGVEGGEVLMQGGISDGDVVISGILGDEGDDGRHVAKVRYGVSEAEV